ncbi:hypothetical protein M427DRAFT_51970 [Gonapodya prolifera JEL478]|uniref:Uncharacterized protein n=1 Tax=Gonapodya prolifera (strain JEL478) TaxID=1344416 RepID=A0A139AX36_GONPJ|nr:hypothetical protein M427DRAFT_51970 [Gonapodya prolifera JEL478]|eukprot:KXS21035.1 hypothetical protein M427DRAFT_51970 [Gonapodya prolifera JEL478]
MRTIFRPLPLLLLALLALAGTVSAATLQKRDAGGCYTDGDCKGGETCYYCPGSPNQCGLAWDAGLCTQLKAKGALYAAQGDCRSVGCGGGNWCFDCAYWGTPPGSRGYKCGNTWPSACA